MSLMESCNGSGSNSVSSRKDSSPSHAERALMSSVLAAEPVRQADVDESVATATVEDDRVKRVQWPGTRNGVRRIYRPRLHVEQRRLPGELRPQLIEPRLRCVDRHWR